MNDEHLFTIAVSKGHNLARCFKQHSPPSEWQSFNDLANTGWRQTHIGPRVPDTRTAENRSRRRMYQDLRLSLDPGLNTFVKWEHTDPGWAPASRNRPMRQYQPTGGHYQCVFNPAAIIAVASESPKTMGYDNDILGQDVVPLCHWSDVVFLQWLRYCQERRAHSGSLRVITQNDIDNHTTKAIVRHLQRHGMPDRAWGDGIATFELGSDGYHALLASPNGVGPAHLLLDHQATLGRMVITAVSCFHHEGTDKRPVNLCFHVAPWPWQ